MGALLAGDPLLGGRVLVVAVRARVVAHAVAAVALGGVGRRADVQVVQLALVEVAGLEVAVVGSGPLIAEAFEPDPGAGAGAAVALAVFADDGQARVPRGAAAGAPDVIAPDGGGDGDDGQDDLARLLVGGPLGVVELLVLGGLVRLGVVGSPAHGGVGQLLAVEEALGRRAADAADVYADEAVQHVARAARIVERYHVRRVVEEHVRQVPRLLPEAGGLALEGPVAARRPVARRQLEALPAVPLHVADEGFRAEMVANQVLGTREEEHVYLV